MTLLTTRDRARSDLSRRLIALGYARAEVTAVLDSLIEQGYLNDRRFAAAWARGRLQTKPMGARRLRQELEAKGIEGHLVREVLKEVYEDGEEAAARRAVAANASRVGRRVEGSGPGRMARYLERRGFSTELIWRLVREGRPPHRGNA
ncbi:MAG: regulatory protein RecX [Candidatus Methylomirabilaceae bacterium]